jgi:hypothetical protein
MFEKDPSVKEALNLLAFGLHANHFLLPLLVVGIALSSRLWWPCIYIPVVSINKVQLPGALLLTN